MNCEIAGVDWRVGYESIFTLLTSPFLLRWVPFGKRPKTLPVVLGRQEVDELLACTKNLKQRIFITTLYGTGMRFSEAANLQVRDIDSARMQIRITHGKGAKQRQVPLSPRLLSELREYWKAYDPTSLLFPGKTPEKTYCDTSIQKAIKASALAAGINKNVTPHTLRHSYATGLLEAGVDLLTGENTVSATDLEKWEEIPIT